MPGGDENQELGDLGESDFQGWCIRNSLRCTKSNPDRMGWDFFVEFPSQATRGRSLDSQNDLKKVMIQVKASRNKFEQVRCKLSALKNLVDADIPAFIACLQFNGDNRVIHAMLVHIGTAAIEVILRRVRQAEADGAPDLHRTFLSLPLDDANEIHLDGSNLRGLLEQHIGGSNSQYLQQKIRARASCGYDHNSIGVNFSFDGDDEQLVEFLIGRHPEITITNLTIERRRFGIALPSDIDRIENGTLSVKSSDAAEATITVSNETLGRTVKLAAEISSTAGIELPQNLHRMRLNNDCFDIVFNFGAQAVELKFLIESDAKFPLTEISRRLQAGYLLSEAGTILSLQRPPLPKLELPITCESSRLTGYRLLHQFVEIFTTAILKYRSGMDPTATLSQITSAFDSNKAMFATLTRRGFRAVIPSEIAQKMPAIRRFVVVIPTVLCLNEITYLAVAVSEATWTVRADGSIEAIGGHPTIVWDGIEREENSVALVMEKTISIAKANEGENIAIITGSVERSQAPADEQMSE